MFKPQFKACYRVEVLDPDTTFLLTEGSHRILTGRGYRYLAPLLNGNHSMPEIIQQMEGHMSAPELYFMVNQLAARGYVVETTEAISKETAAYLHLLGNDTEKAAQKLGETAVCLQTIGNADSTPLENALTNLNITLAPADESDLLIVVTDDYLRPELAEINAAALKNGRFWLLCKLTGTNSWLGPLFTPTESACWHCLAVRLQGNRQVEGYIQRKRNQTDPIMPKQTSLTSTVGLSANLLATELYKWITNSSNQQLHNQLLTFNSITTTLEKHAVIQRPQCPTCGDPAFLQSYKTAKPIVLQENPKQETQDGGHRALPPSETLKRHQKQISPITGVVSSLESLFEDSNNITFSYAAGHNFALTQDDMHMLKRNLRTRSGGKGMTRVQAKVSAIGEAMERYSGVFRGDDEIIKRATYSQLGDSAVHLHDVLLFSDSQYANREAWNKSCDANLHLVPNRFDENATLDWTPLWSLTNQTFKYMPTAFCYFGHPDLKHFYCGSDSNGTSAGNSLEEAILQGFLELVERDAVAIWWYNMVKRPLINIHSFNDSHCSKMVEFYAQHNRSLWVLDLTTDLNIPVFAAISGRTDKETEDIIVGFGAHLDPKVALRRALSEISQLLPSVWKTKKDGATHYYVNDSETLEWFTQARMSTQTYLVPDKTVPAKQKHSFDYTYRPDIKQDLDYCLNILHQKDLELLVLDMTRPDVGLHACRVVVPGLRHFWRRLGPGRLYDVPVKLGWRTQPLTEAELNPISVFY